MRQAEAKAEPKTEPFEEGDKVATAQQQSTQNQLQSPVATSQANSSFVDTNGNSEGNEILVLVPALNANGLTTANITTEYRENGRNLDRKTNELQTNYTRDNNTRNIVTEQIVWIPKIEAQSQQDGHQATTSAGNTVCQPPPLYSRIKQLNYSQVETNVFSLFNKKTHPKNLSKKKLRISPRKTRKQKKKELDIECGPNGNGKKIICSRMIHVESQMVEFNIILHIFSVSIRYDFDYSSNSFFQLIFN